MVKSILRRLMKEEKRIFHQGQFVNFNIVGINQTSSHWFYLEFYLYFYLFLIFYIILLGLVLVVFLGGQISLCFSILKRLGNGVQFLLGKTILFLFRKEALGIYSACIDFQIYATAFSCYKSSFESVIAFLRIVTAWDTIDVITRNTCVIAKELFLLFQHP